MGLIHSKDFVTDLDPACIQPNAVDVRIHNLEEFTTPVVLDHEEMIVIGEDKKSFIPRVPGVYTVDNHVLGADYWVLAPGRCYDVVTKHKVKIPEGAAGWLIIRSTLSRNGILLSGGLYDSGYDGTIGFTLHNNSKHTVYLEKNCRVAQFIMAQADSSHLYDGYYNKNEGLSK